MLTLFLFVLSAFAARPMLSLNAAGITNPTFGGTANTMMFKIPIDYTMAMKMGVDHDTYVGIGPSGASGAASTCSKTNNVPVGGTGTAFTWSKVQVGANNLAGTLTFTVYNFVPGATYYWKAAVGGAVSGTWNTFCNGGAALPTPTLRPR
jgi:hypothetical protein